MPALYNTQGVYIGPPIVQSDGGRALARLEERNAENPSNVLTPDSVWSDWSYYGSSAGVSVTSDTAMRFSAVYAAIDLIANSIALLPLALYRQTDTGREVHKRHPLQRMLNRQPNPYMTWYSFLHTLVTQALTRGNGYALITRDGAMRVTGLTVLEPGQISVVYQNIGTTKYLYYLVDGIWTESYNVLHLSALGNNGVEGKSPIALFAESIGLGLAAEKFGAKFFGSGANSTGVLSTEKTLSKDTTDALRNQFEQRYGGIENSHKPLVLQGGLKWDRVSIPPNEAQFIETRKFQIEDIARIYHVPQHKLGALDRATNNNIEQQAREFHSDCLLPWCARLQQELERKLLADSEKDAYDFAFDFRGFLQADAVARATYYRERFNTGSITGNEIRQAEGENVMEGLDAVFVQMNMQRVTAESHNGPVAQNPMQQPTNPPTQ